MFNHYEWLQFLTYCCRFHFSGVVLAGTGKSFTPHILTVNTGEVRCQMMLILSLPYANLFPNMWLSVKWWNISVDIETYIQGLIRFALCSLQDVSSKIMQFAQHGPRAMCVLSANGAVSNVMLRQESSSGGTVTYEVVEGASQSINVFSFWTDIGQIDYLLLFHVSRNCILLYFFYICIFQYEIIDSKLLNRSPKLLNSTGLYGLNKGLVKDHVVFEVLRK